MQIKKRLEFLATTIVYTVHHNDRGVDAGITTTAKIIALRTLKLVCNWKRVSIFFKNLCHCLIISTIEKKHVRWKILLFKRCLIADYLQYLLDKKIRQDSKKNNQNPNQSNDMGQIWASTALQK